MGTGPCALASRGAPCRRAPFASRGAPAFRRDIPFLRLLLGSKGVEVVEVISLASHGSLLCLKWVCSMPELPTGGHSLTPPNKRMQLTRSAMSNDSRGPRS